MPGQGQPSLRCLARLAIRVSSDVRIMPQPRPRGHHQKLPYKNNMGQQAETGATVVLA